MNLEALTKSLKSRRQVENDDEFYGFFVSGTGQVESGDFPGEDGVYVKYDFTYGSCWTIVDGVDKAISQISNPPQAGRDTSIIWNFPVEILFKSTSAHGWPRLVLSVFGIDGLGRDVAKGYGSVLIPTMPGRYERAVRMFKPVESSRLQSFVSWIRGTPPEFYDSRFAAKGQGREGVRVASVGTVKVILDVSTRGMAAHGYESGTRAQVNQPTRTTDPPQGKEGNKDRIPLSPVH